MSPAELRELRRPHRERRSDLFGIGAFAATFLCLIFFHAGPLAWAAASAVFGVAFVVVLCAAASLGDDIADEAFRAARQEAQAREDTRPCADIVTFPKDGTHPPYNEQRPAGRPGAA